MRSIFARKITVFLLLVAIITLISACITTGPDTVSRSDFSTADDASAQEVDESPQTTGSPETRQTRSEPADVLIQVSNYWKHGDLINARNSFWSPSVQALKDSDRHDQWALWRSRLYLQNWDGAFFGLAGENISAILSDTDDIWMGTWTGGLSRYSRPLDSSENWDPGLPSKAVRTVNRIRRHGDTIHVIRYGELSSYNQRTSRWTFEKKLPVEIRLQDYLIRGNTEYLASLGDGLWVRIEGRWERLSEPGLFINRLEMGKDNEIIVATMDRGIHVYNVTGDSWITPDDDRLRYANVTSAISLGNMIIGGTYGDGAFYWNRDTGETEFFDESVLGDGWVLSVVSRGSWVYFATFGAGLNCWNVETGEWDRISISEGLPTGDIASLAIAEDDAIWAGTLGGGIVRIEDGVHGD